MSIMEPPIAEPKTGGDDPATAMAAQSRTLRNSVISLAVFFVIVAGLLFGVPGLRSAGELITDADPLRVASAVSLEILSCAGYVVLFGLVFGMLDRHLISRLSLSELAVNSVVSVSGLAGIALGAWVLRSKGISVQRIAQRSVLIFVLTSAVNVGAVAIIGLGMWAGPAAGIDAIRCSRCCRRRRRWRRSSGCWRWPAWAGRAAFRRRAEGGRMVVALTALSDGVFDAVHLIGEHDWRLLGAVAYWAFDNLALYACLAAFGPAPSVWVVAMAYLVGMLANSLPIPAGVVAVEGGLVGMLLLFGVRPASMVLAAVVIYRAISLWVPALIGSVAFLSLRREIGKPLRAARVRIGARPPTARCS